MTPLGTVCKLKKGDDNIIYEFSIKLARKKIVMLDWNLMGWINASSYGFTL